jgi:hypothetical protein
VGLKGGGVKHGSQGWRSDRCVEKYGVRYTKPSRFSLTSLTVSCVYKTGHAASVSYDNNQPSPFSHTQTYPLSVPCPYDGVTPVPTGWRSKG